jgi:hypothetical protein
MLNRRHAIIAATSLTGCVATVPRAALDDKSFRKTLIVSVLDERIDLRIVDKTRLSGTLGKQQLPPMSGLNESVVQIMRNGLAVTRPQTQLVAASSPRDSAHFERQSRFSGFWTSANRDWVLETARRQEADSVLLIDDAGERPEYYSKESGAAVSYGDSVSTSEVRIFAAARVQVYSADGSHLNNRYANTTRFYPLSAFRIDDISRPMEVQHAHARLSRALSLHMVEAVRNAAVQIGYVRADA